MKRFSSTYALLSLLPQTLCVSPKEVKSLYQSSRGKSIIQYITGKSLIVIAFRK